MGTWGAGPFENDAAADFIDQLGASPVRGLTKALRAVADAPAGGTIDVDDGGACWAACELVALSFGRTEGGDRDAAAEIVAKLAPKEEHRLLALRALPRIAARGRSELADLWHEGSDGQRFDAALDGLRGRLEAASTGAVAVAKPKAGDVIGISTPATGAGFVAVQIVGATEVAGVEGTFTDDASAIAALKREPARRIPASAAKLLQHGRPLGSHPVRKDLKGKKLYAGEAGALTGYVLLTANGGGAHMVSYEEAREHDEHRQHGVEEVVAIALGASPPPRVRSPEQREAALVERDAAKWGARRTATTPGPFGDVENLERLVRWIEDYGAPNAVDRFHDESVGAQGYGRPNEDPERRSYAFAAIVALWRGTWPRESWPTALAERLPPRPDEQLFDRALQAARVLAEGVVTRDAEIRLIWDNGPDQGAELRKIVGSLQKALA